LALEVLAAQRPAQDCPRSSCIDPAHEPGEPALGRCVQRRLAPLVGDSPTKARSSRAEFQANKLSPARMLFVGPHSAPNSAGIPAIEALAASRVRIHSAPPMSSPFLIGSESIEIRAPAAYFARHVAAESATDLANRGSRPICLCSEEIRCHERILCDRGVAMGDRYSCCSHRSNRRSLRS
jgi:hypothetical protein